MFKAIAQAEILGNQFYKVDIKQLQGLVGRITLVTDNSQLRAQLINVANITVIFNWRVNKLRVFINHSRYILWYFLTTVFCCILVI